MACRALAYLAFWAGLAVVAAACNRYEVAPGYEDATRTPAPPECSARPGSITPEQSSDSVALDSTVSGRVLDEHGRPVSSALVTLAWDSELRASTDTAGHFEFARPTAGQYWLSVRAVGYNQASTEITVSEDTPQFYSVVLPVLIFDGPCSSIVVVRKPWWKWW